MALCCYGHILVRMECMYFYVFLCINDVKMLILKQLLTTARYRQIEFIEESAFFRCYSLESVTLPDSVKEIGESAFEECASLINIHIPKSVTVIGKHAFANCECLSEIKIPLSVGSLGNFAFEDCYSLESLFIDEGVLVIGFGTFRGCQSLTNILISTSLRDTVEEAFDCDTVANITLFRKTVLI